MEKTIVRAITQKDAMSLVRIAVAGTAAAGALLGKGLAWLWENGETPLVTQQAMTAQGGFIHTLVFSSRLVDRYIDESAEFATSCGCSFKLEQRVDDLGCLTIVGEGFWQSPETIGLICRILPDSPVLLEARNSAISICLPTTGLVTALNALHHELIENCPDS